MKKIIGNKIFLGCFILLLWVFLSGTEGGAGGGTGTVVSIQDCLVDAGDSITIPIMIYNVTNMGDAEINLSFDSSVVNVLSFSGGDFDLLVSEINNSNGWARAGGTKIFGNLSGDVVLANITLQAVGVPGETSPSNFTHILIHDATPQGNVIPASPQNGTFTINDTLPPQIENITASPNPQEVGGYVNITCNVTDAGGVNIVKVNITGPPGFTPVNTTMNTGSYYYNATYLILGTYHYFIWANDTSGNSNVSATYTFTIHDTTLPEIRNVSASPQIQETGSYVNITCIVTDNVAVNVVKVNITYPDNSYHNFSMNGGSYYYNATYSMIGTYHYFIWANDTSSNSNKTAVYSFYIYDPSVVYVDDDFDASTVGWQYDHFNKIQDGINAVNEGGIVYIFNGTYNENVDVGKTVSIIGNDSANCIVQSFTNDDVFYVNANWVNISGLTVKGAQSLHAGIHLYYVTHCNISNVNASDNIYGIYLDYSNNNILINNTAFFNDYYGIYSVYSDYNTLIENNCSYNSDGIYLYFSDYNVLKNNTAMENNHWDINIYSASYNTIENTTGSGNRPIAYYDSNVNIANATFSELILWNADYSVFTNITIEGSANLDNNGIIISETDYATLTYINSSNNFYGLWLKYSNNNHLSNLICTGGDTGIYLFTSDYNTISNSNFSNNEIGIYMYGYHQNGNAFYNDTAFNGLYSAFSADDDSHGNIVENLSVASYPTRMSFTFDNGIRVRGVDAPPPNPAGMGDIGKYVNITNITANSWINISIYYEDAELGLVEEDTLRMWRYNGTTWEMVSQPNNVSIADNYVYANITSFSIFAPLGELPMPVQNLRTGELFMTIQSAINDNDTIDGDTIIVYESVFRENVLVNKSLILKAGSSPIIDGMGGIAITIVVDNVTVEGFDITNSSTGIYVHNALFTIQNVTIRNCNIYNCTGGNGVGIKFENVNKSGITGCEIYNNTLWGIQLSHSSNNTIYNNTVYNHTAEWNSAGIVVFSSSNYNNISSNIVYNNEIDNIELWNNSFYNEIWNNTVYGAEYGILLSRNANNNTMIKNTIYNNTYGIGIGHSNTTWGGAANNNLVLKNIIISSEYIGIYLFNSTFNNISYNNLSTNFVGVQLQSSNWSVIISNNILFNLAQGIYLCYSNNNTIMNNTAISNWGTGIKLEHSSNNNLMDNILYNDSIYLTYSHYNTLSYNTILNNSEHELGIYLHYSDNNTVSSNFAYSNFAGITLFGSCENNTIFDCVIINNDYGILIGGNIYAVPSNNTIYNNYFDNIINAYVGGNNINNIWNVSKTAGTNIVGGPYIGGNYWSDYNGTDTDGDGLGDTNLPYNAGGNITKGGDWLPLVARVYNLNQDRWYYYIQSAIDNASNGDTIVVHDGTYKENVVIDKEITLINGSKPIIDGMGGIAFNITANNVSIIGFNITNSSYGIKCNASGFYIANNTFWYDRIGFRWNIEERPTEDYTIYDGIVEKNKFYMNKDYKTIFAYISLDYNGNGPYNVTIGNITIWDNTFYMNGSNAIGVHISEEIGDLYGGNISAGTVNISNNKIYGGWGAVDFSGDFYDLTDVNVSAGDVIINKNIMLNQLLGGVSTDYYSAGLWNGNTTGIFGDLIINGNKIYSSSLGIYISPEGFGAIMHDNATAVLGFTNISNNIINSGKHGIYFYAGYLGYEMYDNASIGVGKFIIHNNNITANDNYDGIHICAEYWGYNMSHNSSCNIGNFKIIKNNVSCKNGIYFEYFHYVGCNLSDNASVIIGDFAINDNTINASNYGIYINHSYFHSYFCYWGYKMYDNASIVIGNFSFNRNKIKAGSDGIYLYMDEWATYMHNNSAFYLGEFEFIGNEIEAGGYGLYVWPSYMGWYMYGNATAMIGDWYIIWNNITSGDDGIDTGPGVGYSMYDNTSVVMGDFFIMHNNISSSGYCAILYEVYHSGEDVYGNSSVVIGETHITNNIVNTSSCTVYFYYDYVANAMFDNSSLFIGDVYIENNPALNAFDRDAIYVEYYNENVGDGLYGNSSARLPDYIIRNNTINASDDGISMYTKHNPDYMYNNSSIYFGGWLIDNNIINAGDDGISLDYYEFCYYVYDNSTTEIGDIVIVNNKIRANGVGIGVYYDDIAYVMYDNASLLAGNVTVHNNTINCSYGIAVGYYSVDTNEYVDIEMGYINITENRVKNCTNDGIYLYYSLDASRHSSISIERALIDGNIIDNCTNGIYVYGDIYNDTTAILDMNGIVINNNTISNCSGYDSGIHIEDIDGNEVTNNTLFNCSYSIALIDSASNYVFNNTIYSPLPYGEYYYGIYVKYVNYSNISWNNIIYNISQEESYFTGIYAYHSNNNTMDNNTIEKEGIAGDDSDACGVYLEASTWNIVENNFVFSYNNDAIHLYESSNNTIRNNTLTNNFTYYGVCIHSSSHNLVLNNAIYNVSEGISLVYSGNNKVINNTIRNVTSYGIESAYSPSQRNIINRNTIYNGTGIVIYSCSNNIISNNTIRDIRRGYFPMTPPRGAAGIWIGGGTNNYFFNNTITGSNETCDVYGVLLKYASNNIFSFTEIRNLRSTSNVYAFYSDENSKNNSIYNMTLASYPTTISFKYGNGIALKGVLEEEIQSNGELLHIGKFINVTGVTVSSWINVTIHYTEQEIWMVNESSMKLYRYNETSGEWENVTFILNETHNYIKANLTKFSIYGIWGEIGVEEVNISLNKGWNLITIPVILNWKAEDLAVYINTIAHAIYGFDICDTIVMLDAFSQKHIGHPVGAGIPPGSINNFDIVHGVGYWIFVNQSITFNITGTIIKNITIDLQPGFNLLGWTHDNSTNASEVADEIENITMVVEWNNSLDDFITYLKELGAIDFVIARGDGFYVFLAGESEKWYGM